MDETIGFIGVGRMGSRMASNLLDAGYRVVVFDLDDERVDSMVEDGAEQADSITDVASEVSIVMTSLPSSEAVSAVYFGEDSLIEAADNDTLLVEMSTIETEVIKKIDANVEESEVVDCPVIGTPPEAAAGTLTIVVGSSEAAYKRLAPVLEPLSNSRYHVGKPGAANQIKLANNVMTFSNFAIAAEMTALVEHIGIDPEQFFEITSSGVASAAIADLKMPKALEEDFEAEFTVDDSRKDLQYALSMKEEATFSAPIASSVAEQYTYASQVEGSQFDYSILLKAFAKSGN